MTLEHDQTAPAGDTSFESAFTDASSQSSQATQAQPDQASQASQPSQTQQAEPTQQYQPQAPQAPNPLFEQARHFGIDLPAGANEAQLAQQALERLQQLQPYAQYGQHYISHADQFQQWMEQQNQQQVQQQQFEQQPEWSLENYFAEKWKAPAWDPKFDKMIQSGIVVVDEATGLYRPAPGYEMVGGPIVNQINEAAQAKADQIRDLFNGNPLQRIYESMEEPILRRVEEMFQERLHQRDTVAQTQNLVEKFEQANGSWMYARDPATGRQVATQQGAAFLNEVVNLRQSGINDPQTLVALAYRLSGVQHQQPAAPAQQQLAAPPLQAAMHNPTQANATQQQTFLANALQRASYSPQAGATTATSPDSPVVVDENGLNSMFRSAFQASRGT